MAALLLLLSVGTLWPGLSALNTVLIGDPGGDNLRGLWGLDQASRALRPPNAVVFSREFNFPFGGWALLLPFVSGVAASPLGLVFDANARWNLAILLSLWSTGVGCAAWVRLRTGSWSAALAAAAALMGQPMLLHAVADGTPEHLGFGVMMLGLCLLERLIAHPTGPRAAVAGLSAGLIALDSPYQAVFFAILATERAPLLLLRLRRRGLRGGLRVVAAGLAGLAVAGAALMALYSRFPAAALDPATLRANRAGNAVSLLHWWRLETGAVPVRDPSLVPSALAVSTLVPAVGLAVVALGRSLGALAAGTVCLVLALGVGAGHASALGGWLGSVGVDAAQRIEALNVVLFELPGISGVRFPRRFLVPAAMALLMAGGLGWAALERRVLDRRGDGPGLRVAALALGATVGLAGSLQGQRVMGLRSPFPLTELPPVAAMAFIAAHPSEGAVALLPEKRASKRALQRHELPVFGGLESTLGGAAPLYLQVLHGRPQVSFPALLTLAPRARTPRARSLLEDWDVMTAPATLGEPPPLSATRPNDDGRRAVGLDLMLREGLRFLVLDDALYADAERAAMRRQLGRHLVDEQVFADGTGLRVMVLAP